MLPKWVEVEESFPQYFDEELFPNRQAF